MKSENSIHIFKIPRKHSVSTEKINYFRVPSGEKDQIKKLF